MKIVSSGGYTITNTNIVSEQMSLEKSLCSDQNLRFGRCEAACFKVRIADIDHDFTGEWLNVTQSAQSDIEGFLLAQDGKYLLTEDGKKIRLKSSHDYENLSTYGRFKVQSCKPDNDRRWRNLTCFDAMKDILSADVASWYDGLTFPMTIKNFRDSFFAYLGVTQVTTTLINDNLSIKKGFSLGVTLDFCKLMYCVCRGVAVSNNYATLFIIVFPILYKACKAVNCKKRGGCIGVYCIGVVRKFTAKIHLYKGGGV